MPRYAYKCRGCGLTHDESRCVDDRDVEGACIMCGCPCIHQVSTGTNFVLKGKGWGADGYAKRHGR